MRPTPAVVVARCRRYFCKATARTGLRPRVEGIATGLLYSYLAVEMGAMEGVKLEWRKHFYQKSENPVKYSTNTNC